MKSPTALPSLPRYRPARGRPLSGGRGITSASRAAASSDYARQIAPRGRSKFRVISARCTARRTLTHGSHGCRSRDGRKRFWRSERVATEECFMPMVRVSETTLARLASLRERLLKAHQRAAYRAGDYADGASMDARINRLLDQNERHGRRRRRQLERQRTNGGRAAVSGQT
jgi:hypothetical protein